MDNRQRCFVQLKNLSHDLLTDQELNGILDRLEKKRNKRYVSENDYNDVDVALEDALEEFNLDRLDALVRMKQFIINSEKKAFLNEKLEAATDAAIVVENILSGSVKNRHAAATNIDSLARSTAHRALGGFLAKLRKEDVYDSFQRMGRDKKLQDDTIQEMYNITDGVNKIDTRNAVAKRIAKAMVDVLAAQRKTLNDNGAYIAELPGYIMRQSYDRHKLKKIGFEAFKELMLKELDPKVINGDPDFYLKNVYQNLVVGVHDIARGADSWLTAMVGPKNVGKRVSHHRELHYKDAMSWLRVHREIGIGNIAEAFTAQVTNNARNITLMRKLGTNPEAMIDWLIERVDEVGRAKGDLEARSRAEKLKNRFWTLTNGAAYIPENISLARNFNHVRQWIAMSRLGGMVISSVTDLANQISTYLGHNIKAADTFRAQIKALFSGGGDAASKEFAEKIGAMSMAAMQDMIDNFASGEVRGGFMTKMVNGFYKATGINYWMRSLKTAGMSMLSENLAKMRSTLFDALPEDLRLSLERYDIGDKEWRVFQKSETSVGDGRNFMSPEEVGKVDDSVIKEYLGNNKATQADIRRVREELQEKLAFYYNDTISEAMSEGNIVQRAVFTGGGALKPGTWMGEIVKSFWQFKSFVFNMMYRHWGRILHRSGKGQLIPSALTLLVPAFMLGYVAHSAKQLVKGQEPLDPTDPKAWAMAMLQSGGLGIFSDFLFSSTTRYGNSFASTLGGPGLSTLEDIHTMFNSIREGKGEQAASKLISFIQGNTPFANIPGVQTAANLLIFDHMREFLDPGITREVERRREREGYNYWYKRSDTIATGGGFK